MNRRLMLSGLLFLTILLLTVYSTRKAEADTAPPVHDGADLALVAAPYREYGVSDQSQPESQQDAGWITAAWIPYNAGSNLVYERGLGSFLANCQYINMVNPVWFLLEEGTTPGTTTTVQLRQAFYDQGRIQDCSESELLLIPVIKTVDDSPRLVHAMLDDNPNEHAELLAQIAAGEVNGYPSQGFDGIEIDYEGIDWAHRNDFSEFVEDLADALHKRGKLLVVTLQVKTGPCVGDGACAQDYARIGRAADFVKIMAYDNNGPASFDPTHHAELTWVSDVLTYATEQIAEDKLILGAPLYGFVWERATSARPWERSTEWPTATYTQALTWLILHGDGALLGRADLDTGKIPFVIDSDPIDQRLVFYEDRISATLKAAHAQARQLAGISFWHAGYEDPGVWPAVASLASSPYFGDVLWMSDGTAKSGNWESFTWIAEQASELWVRLGWKFEPKMLSGLPIFTGSGRFGQAYLPMLSGQHSATLNQTPLPSISGDMGRLSGSSCQMLLRVFRPDGTLYGSLDLADASGEIKVNDPMLGQWEARVSTNCTTEQDFLISAAKHDSDSDPEPEEFKLQVSVQGSGQVRIEPDLPHYPAGALVRLTAQAETGWRFASWTGGVNGTANPLQITMDSDKAITAVFTKEESGWIPIGTGSASSGGISADQFDSVRVDIAVAPDGVLYAAWADQGSGRIFVKAWDGSRWVNIAGSGLSCGGVGAESPAVGVNSNGLPIVVWAEDLGNLEICAKHFDGQNWQAVGGGIVSNSRKDSRDASIAVSADGTLFVAWRDNSSGNYEIYVKRLGGAGWQELGGSASGGGISETPSGYSGRPTITVDLQNRPVVGFADDYSGTRQVYVKRWSGTSWMAVGYLGAGGVSDSSGRAGHAVVKLDGTGNIYLAWQDEGFRASGEIYVKKYGGSGWAEVGDGSAHQGGVSDTEAASGQPTLNIDSEGRACVAWNEGDSPSEIYVRCFNNGTWQELGQSGQGSGVSNNSGNSWRAKMASGPSRELYLLWEDNSGNNDYEIFGLQWKR